MQLDVGCALLLKAIPHTEGLRLVASSTAIFDQDFHAIRVGALAASYKGKFAIEYAPLGRAGLIVSRICLGGNSWGAKGRRGWGKFDEAEAPAYFKRALDVRINFFDTADNYNAGRSEEII